MTKGKRRPGRVDSAHQPARASAAPAAILGHGVVAGPVRPITPL